MKETLRYVRNIATTQHQYPPHFHPSAHARHTTPESSFLKYDNSSRVARDDFDELFEISTFIPAHQPDFA
jgi:hypothetical protein